MKRLTKYIYSFVLFMSLSSTSSAWGPEGHAIVGRIALKYVNDDVRKNVLVILGKMSIDTAANWMDIMKSNADYDFMRPWHYLDFPKGEVYTSSNKENILNRLILTYKELQHKNLLCDDQTRADLLILLHLMGDLHMPLHTGYDDDLGGNKVIVQYDTIKTHNLHRFWDEDIISLGKIKEDDCTKYYSSFKDQLSQPVDFEKWMRETRSLLPNVYDFSGFMLDDAYLQKNKVIVEKQLLLAGLRLAAVLNKLFASPPAAMNQLDLKNKFKNLIDAGNAINYLGKNVTVCERVYAVRSTNTITQINLGGKFPNNPITIVIFAKSYANFKGNIEDMYKDKNICVKGKVQEYKGKAQIIVESPENIILF